jgi:hypothetical protein
MEDIGTVTLALEPSADPQIVLGGALGQFFQDLDHIAAADRSPYENALHGELLELGRGLHHLLSRYLTGATLRHDIRPTILVGPNQDDATRIFCPKNDCPNKRRR